MPKLSYKIGNHTDVGLVRQKNEDYYGSWDTINGQLLVVCDGMGGHTGGEIASRVAAEAIQEYFSQKEYDNIVIALQQSLEYANEKIRNLVLENAGLEGMGTTAVVVLIRKEMVFYGHIGDSRLYLFSKGQLRQLTRDHSFVQQLVDQGLITESEAETHPKRNQITRALGIRDRIEPFICEQPYLPKPGDSLLLCTDGLSGPVPIEEIKSILTSHRDLQKKVIELIDTANNYGGPDNATVQVVQFLPTSSSGAGKRIFSKARMNLLLLASGLTIGTLAFVYRTYGGSEKIVATEIKPEVILLKDSLKSSEMDRPDSVQKDTSGVQVITIEEEIEENQESQEDKLEEVMYPYRIQNGDSSSVLKAKFNLEWSRIRKLNPHYNSQKPKAGQHINLPVRAVVAVNQGVQLDSMLIKIAEKYQVSVAQLKKTNDWIEKKTTQSQIIIPIKGSL